MTVLLEDFNPNQARDPHTGKWVDILPNQARVKKALHADLTSQGISDMAPIRGVVNNFRGSHKAIARGDDGIEGAIDFNINKSGKQIEITDVRAQTKGAGAGRRMLQKIATTVQDLPNSDKYNMKVYGAVSTATSWYMLMGADFVEWSHVGEWSPEDVKKLAAGKIPEPGTMTLTDGSVISLDEFLERERSKSKENDVDISWLPELTEAQQAEALGLRIDELAGRGNAETLRRYWTEGEGAAKIRWGVGGDFNRCVRHLAKYVSDPKGYCSDMHQRATGARPGHAAGEAATMNHQIHESVTFSERAVRGTSGRWEVTVISAGLGSSGYYSPEVLERAAANKLIESGTPLFFDHPAESERSDRPERSVRDIAAVFTGPTRYDSSGKRLVGEVQIFKPYRELVNEMAPHIGLSISGSATDITEGMIEGRKVPVVEDLHDIFSVDLVTKAGRGGQFVSLLESAREQMDHLYEHAEEGAMTQDPSPDPTATPSEPDPAGAQPDPTPDPAPNPDPSQEDHMTETPQGAGGTAPAPTQEAAVPPARPRNPREVMEAQLREQGRQIHLLRAENAARDIVAEVLSTGWIGDQQRARLTASLVRDLPLTESGELDTGALRERAQTGLDEAETEAAEILSAAGVGSPRGLGALETPATEAAGKQFEDELRESMKQRGMSDAAIDIAVKGR